jgi:hypothetical protein
MANSQIPDAAYGDGAAQDLTGRELRQVGARGLARDERLAHDTRHELVGETHGWKIVGSMAGDQEATGLLAGLAADGAASR